MPHIHWVARQNKLEIPNDEEEVNTREIHKCDGHMLLRFLKKGKKKRERKLTKPQEPDASSRSGVQRVGVLRSGKRDSEDKVIEESAS
jgi:hypothetical protein